MRTIRTDKHKKLLLLITVMLLISLTVWQPVRAADDVVLKHNAGKFTVVGKLVKYDGESFIVQSSQFGKMTVSSRNFVCSEGPCPLPKKVRSIKTPSITKGSFGITGSDTIGSYLIPPLLEAYAERNGLAAKRIYSGDPDRFRIDMANKKGVRIAAVGLNTKGPSASFTALLQGRAQIGVSTRRIRDEEVQMLHKGGVSGMTSSRQEHILALDGLHIILSPKNKVNALSLTQVAKIFAGKITDWSQVGGAPGKINRHVRDKTSGAHAVFSKLVLKPRELTLAQNVKRHSSYVDLSDAVARDVRGIGFSSIAFVRNAKVIALSTSCSGPKFPNSFDIKTEEYPLSFRHYLYTAASPSSRHAKKFLDFALSSRGEKFVGSQGFITLQLEKRSFGKQASRIISGMAAASKDLDTTLISQFNSEFSDAYRLSSTFRFNPVSNDMDNRSLRELSRLSQLFASKRYRKKEIFLIGFTNASSNTDRNIVLALSRADQVKKALVKASRGRLKPYRIQVRGYGELLPVSCNDTRVGRRKNRRVEVWVR